MVQLADNLISAKEVCEILGVNVNNLRQITHRKHLKWAEKHGRNVYYKREDVEAFKTKKAK